MSIYNECFQGNYSSVERMQAQAATGAAKSRRQVVGAGWLAGSCNLAGCSSPLLVPDIALFLLQLGLQLLIVASTVQ